MTMATLRDLKDIATALYADHAATLARKFPGVDRWTWMRACAAMRGENVRRNDDQSQDAALAGDLELEAGWSVYIKALHAFYSARDGAGGVLGGRA